eukprot:gnl/MRDRNA2_/MRDRNA2_182014_c0_seq1.p2 gnl/MRDRNA2_/MRDRNA2_182014_c0~~gnl/MRDRNA2_/MRDRNA2_182014_c0_seq1.p2  ORF type:complete len:166 (-),score=25.79 gnl/MRDRNA2_/MRDRNA2_182014_c0_seq1:76-573(-)
MLLTALIKAVCVQKAIETTLISWSQDNTEHGNDWWPWAERKGNDKADDPAREASQQHVYPGLSPVQQVHLDHQQCRRLQNPYNERNPQDVIGLALLVKIFNQRGHKGITEARIHHLAIEMQSKDYHEVTQGLRYIASKEVAITRLAHTTENFQCTKVKENNGDAC